MWLKTIYIIYSSMFDVFYFLLEIHRTNFVKVQYISVYCYAVILDAPVFYMKLLVLGCTEA